MKIKDCDTGVLIDLRLQMEKENFNTGTKNSDIAGSKLDTTCLS